MKPLSWDKQLGLVSPLKCAAIQSGQTNDPSRNETGLDASHHIHVSPEGSGKYFFLDILFNRTCAMAMLRRHPKTERRILLDAAAAEVIRDLDRPCPFIQSQVNM